MIVYFDMDGVLADLVGAMSEFTGIPAEVLHGNPQVSHQRYLERRAALGIYESFRSLKPLRASEWKTLMRALHAREIRVEILTAYGVQDPLEMGDEVHRGKADFLREHYGDLFAEGVIKRFNGVAKSGQKKFYATPESILIDDFARNCREFSAAGGVAVHYVEDSHDELLELVRDLAGLNEW